MMNTSTPCAKLVRLFKFASSCRQHIAHELTEALHYCNAASEEDKVIIPVVPCAPFFRSGCYNYWQLSSQDEWPEKKKLHDRLFPLMWFDLFWRMSTHLQLWLWKHKQRPSPVKQMA